ncbi:hypothetical protein [Rhizobium sp. BK602]|uniref:hypothetical protein n=1 Tax=Rhizobium sp. BK602 TaxID=2586986 RepID=UPI00161E8345|nr:hypothetical protein [Rhizobium sp. BK602]MBB3611535.1 lysylphosphatidylglycerol synthetase-like protein (DUF2156 family) [Rhizobium sp. BK602]
MSILTWDAYDCVLGLVACAMAARVTRLKVLEGRFGKFAIFEHVILPAIFVIAGVIVCLFVEIDEAIVTGIIVTLSALILAMLMAFAPFLFIVCAFFAFAFVTSWEHLTQMAAVLFVGVTIGNLIGFGLGSRGRAAQQ